MKLMITILLTVLSNSTLALALNRGVPLGSTCDEIKKTEAKYGSLAVATKAKNFAVFYTSIQGQKGLLIYQCGGKRWVQSVIYGTYTKDEVILELKRLKAVMVKKYGKPTGGYDSLSWFQKIWFNLNLMFDNTYFYNEFKSTNSWYFKDFTITNLYINSPDKFNNGKGKYSVSFDRSTPMMLTVCVDDACEQVKASEF